MTKLYGILGYPLAHSLSPAMQNAAFAAARVDAHYTALSIPPARIRAALRGLKPSGFSGFNVTVPYKETVLPFLDRVSAIARAAGAVNTIVADRRGRWTGHNTDVAGFRGLLSRAKIGVRGRRVLLLGAGGAAKAVCAAISGEAGEIILWNRTAARARRLRESFPAPVRRRIHVIDEVAGLPALTLGVIINSTSIGLRPGESLRLPGAVWSSKPAAVDLIYNPPVTGFLRDARRHGCRAVNGLDMLLYQGAAAFELWTGVAAPVFAMRRALRVSLAASSLSRRRSG